jgi:hypothetical protein
MLLLDLPLRAVSWGEDGAKVMPLLLMDYLQWPAMACTLAAAWFVGSHLPIRRRNGFRLFILSNFLWIIWGWSAGAYALIVLQIGLFIMNLRGAEKQHEISG